MSNLELFSAATQAWVEKSFEAPTAAQVQVWDSIAAGDDTLVVAPTGSGKTLAAFLWGIDRLMNTDPIAGSCQIVYVSPLKALAFDVERNLNAPLVGISNTAADLNVPVRELTVGVRTGDTTAQERRRLQTHPPDILVTTPESLYLMLTSQAREMFTNVQAVIVDEIHALAGTKRGVHLALSLARLEHLNARRPQRIGLSATVRPPEAVARFLSGTTAEPRVVAPHIPKTIRIDVASPVADLSDLRTTANPQLQYPAPEHTKHQSPSPNSPPTGDQGSVWPHVTEKIVDLITSHTSTLIFTNSRRGAERLTAQINDHYLDRTQCEAAETSGQDPRASQVNPPALTPPAQNPGQSGTGGGAPPVLAKAHHGSMSRVQRTQIEGELKAGLLPAVVATSSLELGIDMGSIDLVIQVGSPPSIAATLQRVGRAGHQVGAVSQGLIIPTHRGDLLSSALIASLAHSGIIEASHQLRQPLDVLAQHIVAMTATRSWTLTELLHVIRTAEPYSELSEDVFRSVLDMLAGRYPSDEFGELRARITWDRTTDEIQGRPGALMLAATNAGTIPDRGLYGVYLVGESATTGGKRVGELDEVMVFESRVGDTFMLGSASWRIEEITHDRVLVTPAAGMPGRLPFWHGDGPARPAELGQAMGERIAQVITHPKPLELLSSWGLDDWASKNAWEYLTEQQAATGVVPDHEHIVVEKFRDDLGDWRIVIHSPYGSAVHAPWALLLAAKFQSRYGLDIAAMHADDGIVLRFPDTDTSWDPLDPLGEKGTTPGAIATTDLFLDPATIREELIEAITGSAHFAARFREAAARSLLLPRRRPNQRQPLWQQRQRAAQLLAVASQFPEFPIILEVVRECLNDDYDVSALIGLMESVERRQVHVVEVTTSAPSPFAQTILFGYVGQFLYDGDAPLADRRAAALSLDPGLLAQLLGQGSAALDDLMSPEAIAQVTAEVGLLGRIRNAETLADVLRSIGPLPAEKLVPSPAPTPEEDTAAHPEQPVPEPPVPEPPAPEFMEHDPVAAPAVTLENIEEWLQELQQQRRVAHARIGGVTMWFAVEDTGRLRDALGMVPPPGIPEAFLTEVPDALTELVARYARHHGPFRLHEIAQHLGIGVAALRPHAQQLVDRGVLVRGQLTAGADAPPAGVTGDSTQYCDHQVLSKIRRRSIALLRREVEPVPAHHYAALSTQWHHIGALRGVDGVLHTIETLAGAPIAASALETLILPSRVRDYSPAMLDELLSLAEVTWVGHGAVGSSDGWISLHTRETAPLLAPEIDFTAAKNAAGLLERIGPGATYPELIGDGFTPDELISQLWQLVWAGALTTTSFAAMRSYVGKRSRGGTAQQAHHRTRGVRRSMVRAATRIPVPPLAQGHWVPTPHRAEASVRGTAAIFALLDRHGLVTRGCVPPEIPGGFGSVYRAFTEAENEGVLRRGYFIDGLGGAQFGLPEATDMLRAVDTTRAGTGVFDATDPAQPFGLALPWPAALTATDGVRSHLPGRKVGGRVVLVGGELVLYLERGGKTLLRFSDQESTVQQACILLAQAVRAGHLGTVTITRTDGGSAWNSTLADALVAAGFVASPRGYILRPDSRLEHSAAASTTLPYPWQRDRHA